MTRSDDVFFFTLIDFLLQVFFFGLLLFAVGQALQQQERDSRAGEAKAQEKLLKAAGVSNITELTDLLTRMAPLAELKGNADFISRNGGREQVEAAVQAASAAGGVDKVSHLQKNMAAMQDRITTLEGGWGKVSCVPNIVIRGRLQPKSVATVVVMDDVVRLEDPTPEFEALLKRHALNFEQVRSLDLPSFRSTFAPVVAQQPECRYFLNSVTRTRYLEPMRAVWSAFRTQ
jgi:hypothetical protein